jgi:hypothetical protein
MFFPVDIYFELCKIKPCLFLQEEKPPKGKLLWSGSCICWGAQVEKVMEWRKGMSEVGYRFWGLVAVILGIFVLLAA